MRAMRHTHGLLRAATVAALTLGLAVATAGAGVGAPLTVTSTIPPWVAPGVAVAVSGFAGASAPVVLRVDGQPVAQTISGPLGRYTVRFRPMRTGALALRVQSAGAFLSAGVLHVRPVWLQAVGDVTFGEQVGPAVRAHGAAYPWQLIAGTLRDADVSVGNLETSISTRGAPATKQYTFRGPPQAAGALGRLAGFDVLTLANNHAVDFGMGALLDTLRSVHQAGVQTIGAGANAAQAHRPAIVTVGGLRIGFLGYSDINPPGFVAGPSSPGTARADPQRIADDVRALRRSADVAVCFFHWGVEMHPEPNARQEQLAAACLDAGAALVIGAHPHVLGPVTARGRGRVVAWSLGNFVFPSSGASARTGILRVALDARGVRSERVIPVVIDGFRPRLAKTS